MCRPPERLLDANFTAFDWLPQIVWCADPNGANIFVNRELRAFTGLGEDALLGYGFKNVIHPDDCERVLERWQHSWLDGEPYEAEFRLRAARGEYRWLCAQARAQLDETGAILYWVGTCHDIHALKQAELREGNLQRLMTALSAVLTPHEVAATVVRELRAALGASDGAVVRCAVFGGDFELLGACGQGEADFARWASVELPSRDGAGTRTLARALHERHLVVTHDVRAGAGTAEVGTLACAALVFEERVVGALALTFAEARALHPDEHSFLEKVAAQTAQALERARLQDAERFARAERERVAQQLASVLRAAPVGLGFLDASLRYVQVNDELAAFNGVSAAQHRGRTLREVVPHIADWVEPLVHEVRTTGQPRLNEEVSLPEAHDPARQRRWLVSLYPVPIGEEGEHGVGLVVQDHSERHATTLALQHLNAELEQRVNERTRRWQDLNAELRALASTLAHDLEEPLRRIGSFLHLIEKRVSAQLGGPLDERTKYHFALVQGEAARVSQVAQDLRGLSRLENRELNPTKVPLRQLVVQVRSDLESVSRGRRVTWRVHDLPVVRGDALLLRQVFAELLANALALTRTRDLASIEVGCRDDGAEVVVWVRDNGAGFDPDREGDLFQGVAQRDNGWSGVGLANVRRIMARHGGRAWADGHLGEGATFFLAFPNTAEAR